MREYSKFEKRLDAIKRESLTAIQNEIAQIEADAKKFSEQYGAEYLPEDSTAAATIARLRKDYVAISALHLQ